MFPSVFVSHGSPTIVDETGHGAAFLRSLGESLGRPKAILCVTAHWETTVVTVGGADRPGMIYDYYGFPEHLYTLEYPAPGAPALAQRAGELIAAAGIPCTRDDERGYDHGTFMPLMLMYPDADIPVAQLSVQPALGPQHELAVGRALTPLRGEDVLILASGGAVHNLRWFRLGARDVPDWASGFETWLGDKVVAGDAESIADYRARTPHGAMAHPRDEHFLPLLVAMGAGGGGTGRVLHAGFEHGAIGMSAYAWG